MARKMKVKRMLNRWCKYCGNSIERSLDPRMLCRDCWLSDEHIADLPPQHPMRKALNA